MIDKEIGLDVKFKNIIIMALLVSCVWVVSNSIDMYLIIVHGIYSTFLIAIGVIAVSTSTLNRNKESIFIGAILGITGMLNSIYIYVLRQYDFGVYGLVIASILENLAYLLPIIAICLCFYNKKQMNIYKGMFYIIVLSIATILMVTFLVARSDFLVDSKELGIINFIVTILIALISGFAFMAKGKKTSHLKSVLVIYVIARFSLYFNILDPKLHHKDALSQTIIIFSIIYMYKYIIYTNINLPYKDLDIINKELTKKSEKLKLNNKKLIDDSKKIKELKKMTQERELQLQERLNASTNSVIIFNEDYEVIYTNDAFTNSFNVIKNYKEIHDLEIEFENNSDLIESVDVVLKSEETINKMMFNYNKKVYQAVFAPLIINSKMTGVLCILVDKTSEKAFEKEMIETNERYESFLESIGDGIIVIEDGKKVYINKSCKKIFKDKVDQIEIPNYKINDNIEKIFIIDGEIIYVEMSFSEYIKKGKEKTIVIVRNITSRKKAQIKLKESQSSYERLMDILPDGICLLKENLSIDYANKSFLEVLGASNIREIENLNIKNFLILSKEEEHIFDKQMSKVIDKNKHVLLIENELITKSKTRVQIEINALPFMAEMEKYIMFIVKDITHKKTSEKTEKELIDVVNTEKVKTEFFANMSHELKTPLNVIYSANQLVESFYQSNKINDYNNNVRSHIDLVRQNSFRLQRLINNIIDLTKMESGYYTLNKGNYNIVSIVEDLFMKIEDYTNKKEISIIFDTEIEEAYANLDKYEFERALLNLLSNCIKFTPNGGHIYVSIYDKVTSVVISVKDTGVGIPEEKLETVFEEFTQVDNTLSRNTEGSGVGLAIVKNLVELHSGSISVKSNENDGTEFIISVPLTEEYEEKDIEKNIYNIDEKIKIEFSDIYY